MSAFALAVLAGWTAGVPLLQRGFLMPEPVRPMAALALLFAASSVLVLHQRVVARVLALLPFLIGATTMLDYGTNGRIYALLFDGVDATLLRLPVRAALGVMFAGLAVLTPRRSLIASGFAGATAFIGVASVVGYLYNATFLPGAAVPRMPLLTAILLVLWSLSFAAATMHHGAGATLLLTDRWGHATRALSAVALAAPVIFGEICLHQARAGLFDVPFALAVVTTGSGFTLVALIALYSSRLRQYDDARAAADELYRHIVEMSQEGICVADADFRFRFVNRSFAEMLGYEPAELIGQHVHKVLHPDERAGVSERLEVRRGGVNATRAEIALMRRDGSIVHAISAATQIRKSATSPGLTLSILSDISERVAAEKALRASEARFRGLYESNIIGVAFWTDDGYVTLANDACLQLFAVRPDELPRWQWSSRHPAGADSDAVDQAAIARLRNSGRCPAFEKEFIRPDGSTFWALITLAAVDAETNVAFIIDVTERVEARRKLERAHSILSARVSALEGNARLHEEVETLAARLSQAHAELETFSYSVSHDLRAPLRAIDGFSRELQLGYEPVLDDQGRQYLGRIRAAAHRMSLLIDDLLALSRVSNTVVHRRHADVTAIAGEIAAEAREHGGAKVDFDIQDGVVEKADPHLLRVVLENLIGNAVKFSSGREKPRVEVFRTATGAIAVRDNGAGFDMRNAEKIFAPFQRLHGTAFEGTGVGLALVDRIVRRHGGSIHVESAPDRGATFFFTLKAAEEAA